MGGYLYAINSDGTLKWRYKTGPECMIPESPAIGTDGTIYISARDNHCPNPHHYLYAFNLTERKLALAFTG
jgi:outer membrane protein assembly factor BamB